MLPEVTAESAELLIGQMLGRLNESFYIKGQDVAVTASIGMAMYKYKSEELSVDLNWLLTC